MLSSRFSASKAMCVRFIFLVLASSVCSSQEQHATGAGRPTLPILADLNLPELTGQTGVSNRLKALASFVLALNAEIGWQAGFLATSHVGSLAFATGIHADRLTSNQIRSLRASGIMKLQRGSKYDRFSNVCMSLGVGEVFPPGLLKELTSIRAQRAGKRSVIFFYEGDEACGGELEAFDDVGGEMYLRACELVAVRNPNLASSDSPTKYAFVNFMEDRRDRIRTELGFPGLRASYVVDSEGYVVSICTDTTGPTAHSDNALMFAKSNGWEREAGWERDFGGGSSSEPPTAAERQAADAAQREVVRNALNLPDPNIKKGQTELELLTEEFFTTGIFEEWKDPEPENYSNPIGDRINRWSNKIQKGTQSVLRDVQDGALDLADAAKEKVESLNQSKKEVE